MTKFVLTVLIVLGVVYAIQVLFSNGFALPRLADVWENLRRAGRRLHVITGVIAAAIVCLYLLRLGVYILRSW